MFVASSLYNYAKGTKSEGPSATPTNTRVKRHAIRKRPGDNVPTSPPPSYASVAAGQEAAPSRSIQGQLADDESTRLKSAVELAKMAAIDLIVEQEDLYEVLGIKRNAKSDDIRRGFLNRSRICHPDKFPSYAPCVVAFQKVSFAYQTLSKPSSRRLYDISGRTDLAAALNDGPNGASGAAGSAFGGMGGEETLNGVLYSVFCEFLDGDFEMIRVLVNAMNESNPGLNLGEDAVDSIAAFAKLREVMLAGKKYLTIIRFELIRLYEIQHSLRQLSYFDVFGRLRLTLQLARVTLSIPMAIDQAMKEPEESEGHADENSKGEEKPSEGGAQSGRRREATEQGGHDDDRHGEESESSSSGEEEEPTSAANDFGMRDEEDDSDDDEGLVSSKAQRRRSRRAQKKMRRRARVEAARKAQVEEREQRALQKKGLLGPTAASLLKGVVKVLETSEGWVPGAGKKGADDD